MELEKRLRIARDTTAEAALEVQHYVKWHQRRDTLAATRRDFRATRGDSRAGRRGTGLKGSCGRPL